MYRAVKDENGVILVSGADEGQFGDYIVNGEVIGQWCEWTISNENWPAISPIEGADRSALRFKENQAGDGLELRTDEEVLSAPFGVQLEQEEVPEEE